MMTTLSRDLDAVHGPTADDHRPTSEDTPCRVRNSLHLINTGNDDGVSLAASARARAKIVRSGAQSPHLAAKQSGP